MMKWIEHNFIARQLVVNEKYKKFVIFFKLLKEACFFIHMN